MGEGLRASGGKLVTGAAAGDLQASISAVCLGWRAWRAHDGSLAARKGGTAPGVQARGATVRQLVASIAAIETAGEAGAGPAAPPKYRAVLTVLDHAAGPLTSRAVSKAAAMELSSTVNALGILCAHGIAERERQGRTWLYRRTKRADPRTGGMPADDTSTAATAVDKPGSRTGGSLQRSGPGRSRHRDTARDGAGIGCRAWRTTGGVR